MYLGLAKYNVLKLYIQFSLSVTCGSVVDGTLKSPAYSNGFYAGKISCTDNISIPDGKVMRLKFRVFALVSDSKCR